jgi:predicted ArsR family transcriptional regulator
VPERFAEDVASISALAERVRRELYLYVIAQDGPVGREQAARAVGLPVHSAKFHLDRLVAEGLLDTEFRRLTARRGPGAGRPAKLYRRSSREVSVTLPERRYDLAGAILADAVERASRERGSLDKAVQRAATEAGHRSAAGLPRRGRQSARAARALARQGYEPRDRDGDVVLANCPFDVLARDHTELVCSMNRSFVGGMLDGLGCDHLEARLDPQPGLCCVRVAAASGP